MIVKRKQERKRRPKEAVSKNYSLPLSPVSSLNGYDQYISRFYEATNDHAKIN
jgi:hypothetical protein